MGCRSASRPPCRPSWRSARARRCSWPAPASRPASGSRRWSLLVDGDEQPVARTGCRGWTAARRDEPTATAAASGASRGSRPRAARASRAGAAGRLATAARRAPRWPRSRSRRAVEPRGAGAAAAHGRDLHDHLRAAAGAVPAPGRVDPRPDPHRLGLRGERRLLGPRALRGASRRCSTTTRASCSRARRAGSASTATSSARWRWRPPGGLRRARRPGRPLAPGQARDAAGRARHCPLIYSDARVVARDGRVLSDTYWGRGATTTPTCSRCWWPTR